MKRRNALKNIGILFGAAVTAPSMAFDLGKAVGAMKSLGAASSISDSELNAYFDQVAAKYDAANTIAAPNSKYAKRLTTLTKGLEHHDGLNLNFKVYMTKEVNAFAMGNGTVRVYSGLMDLMTDDEVSYVLGHEIGHVKAGHSKARMKTALTADAIRSAVAATDGRAATLADSQVGELFQKVVLAQHSQANERQADDYAVSFLKTTKRDPMAAVSALEKIDKLSGGGSGGWFSTHPAPAERAKRIRAQIG